MKEQIKANELRKCPICGTELRPGHAKWDGEPTYVGYLPCINGCNID